MRRPGTASISWVAEMLETTAIGDSAASYMHTGQEEETTEGDQEAVDLLRSLVGEPGTRQAWAGRDRGRKWDSSLREARCEEPTERAELKRPAARNRVFSQPPLGPEGHGA